MQCMLMLIRSGKAAVAAHGQTKAKAARASARREARARRKMRNGSAGLKVNAGKKRHKKAECRKMKADLAADKCDKNGKPTGVNSLTATGATQPSSPASHAPSPASIIQVQQMVPVYFPTPVGSQAFQQTETCFINMIVLAQKNSHGCKLGWSRIRVVGF